MKNGFALFAIIALAVVVGGWIVVCLTRKEAQKQAEAVALARREQQRRIAEKFENRRRIGFCPSPA